MRQEDVREFDPSTVVSPEATMLRDALDYVSLRKKYRNPETPLSSDELRQLACLVDKDATYLDVLEQHFLCQRAMKAWRNERRDCRRNKILCLFGGAGIGISLLLMLPTGLPTWFWDNVLQWCAAGLGLLGILMAFLCSGADQSQATAISSTWPNYTACSEEETVGNPPEARAGATV